jgi:uncharacterized protein (DUF58 family)
MSAAALAPPAGRQGPGSIPHALVDAIDVLLVRLVAHSLPGDRRAAGVGRGTELAQLRPYEPGDDVRHLDAAATARTGQPHVRLHVPERTLTTWIALDVSPSMAFGSVLRLKSDVAEGVVLVLARLAVRRAGSVGVVAFGADAPILLPPRGGRTGLAAVGELVRSGVAADGAQGHGGLADALRRIALLARRPSLVVVVSDFRGDDTWTRALPALCARHTVLAIEVHDPREATLPAGGRLALIDPETGERIEIESSERLRARFAEIEQRRRAEIAANLRRQHVTHAAVGTDGEWTVELARALAEGGRR